MYLSDNYYDEIKRDVDRPTKSKIELFNGSRIISLPVGLTGEGVRFLTIHKLTVDEAQLPPDEVFTAITPMLLTTGGTMGLLGTPQGKRGYFWKAYENLLNQFKIFHVNSEWVIKNRKISETWTEWRRKAALDHLAQEKLRMSDNEYRQEYLGEFIEDIGQVYPDWLIKRALVLKRREGIIKGRHYFLGVDVGRMGSGSSTFEIIDRISKIKREHVESITTDKTHTTETTRKIIELERTWKFNKILVDSIGIGSGVLDQLLEEQLTKRKVIGIENISKKIEHSKELDKEPKQKSVPKDELYIDLKVAMERDEIKLLDDDELSASLKSVLYEYIDGRLRIFGNNTHKAEGLIRANYGAKQKGLNIYYY
jgi:hypothetical protein